jgi:hypothetical protein
VHRVEVGVGAGRLLPLLDGPLELRLAGFGLGAIEAALHVDLVPQGIDKLLQFAAAVRAILGTGSRGRSDSQGQEHERQARDKPTRDHMAEGMHSG